MENEVTFEPLSSWQKPDCINGACKNEASQEAVLPFIGGISKIRCCGESKCMEFASMMARAAAGAFR